MTDAKKGEDLASAYEGLEDASSFPDAASVERYRHLLVARTAIQADFLIRRIPAPARLLEVACGNGRLLIEMARRRAIASGLGLDVARSRIAFAERWAADEVGTRSNSWQPTRSRVNSRRKASRQSLSSPARSPTSNP
jgi:2-polyprenyl-3-methyl-5-hydroxy-6-metoxy-1,4-benzoquinol methylase